MRAHRTRRTLWILNALVGIPLLAVTAWQATEVHAAAAADPVVTASRPGSLPAAREAVAAFGTSLRNAGTAALGTPVRRTDVEATFHTARPLVWFPLTGPIQPPRVDPPPPPPRATSKGLGDYGRILMLFTDRPQITFAFSSGGSVIAHPGDVIEPPRSGVRFRFVRLEEPAPYHYEVIYTRGGGAGEATLVFTAQRAPGPKDPVRPERPVTTPDDARGAETPASSRLDDIAREVERVQVVRAGNRVQVRMPRRVLDRLRGDEGELLASETKTREVALPGGGRGVELTFIPVKAEVLHKIKLANGDVLISVNGKPTPTRGTLMQAVRALPESTRRVTVVVDRGGRRLSYELEAPATR